MAGALMHSEANQDKALEKTMRRKTMPLSIPSDLIVHETQHWRINQRIGCPVPGYLMMGTKASGTSELSELPVAALRGIGPLLANAAAILRNSLGAERVYIGRYGHDVNCDLHFHLIPIYSWITEAYRAHPRYNSETDPDGANLTLFVWREYCESPQPAQCQGPSVPEAIAVIRQQFARLHR